MQKFQLKVPMERVWVLRRINAQEGGGVWVKVSA